MNVFSKAYCRTVQFFTRCAMPFLPYRDPVVVRSIDDVPEMIKNQGLSHPLIVTGPRLMRSGAVDSLISALEGGGLNYSVFSEVNNNPTTDTVEDALRAYNDSGCDSIVAFGGGSPMDAAKAMGARVTRPKKSLKQLKGVMKVRKKIPYFIAIPTTCGTGSETTIAAVIVDSQSRHKYAMSDFSLIPSVAVLDARTLDGLPSELVAYTGFDALTHAVEAYIGNSTTSSTRADALKAIKLIFENLIDASGGDTAAKSNMLDASFYAGRAFTRSLVGYVHALAHPLGGKYDIGHGKANAVLLPIVLREYGKRIYKKLKQIAVYCGFAKENDSVEAAANSFFNRLDMLGDALNIPKKFDCIVESDIEEMARYAAKEGNPMYPVPVLWNTKKLAEIYKKARA